MWAMCSASGHGIGLRVVTSCIGLVLWITLRPLGLGQVIVLSPDELASLSPLPEFQMSKLSVKKLGLVVSHLMSDQVLFRRG
jgi:hypothetical protein